MITRRNRDLVLGIYPTTRGFGFVLMSSPLSPIDWGTRGARGANKNAQCLTKVARLIEIHQPDVIVLQDTTAPDSRRSSRIRRLCRSIAALAAGQAIDVQVYSRAKVRAYFEGFGARTRYEIATAIAKHVTAFEHFLPPPRKLWMNEDTRMSLFDAASHVMTYYWDGDEEVHNAA